MINSKSKDVLSGVIVCLYDPHNPDFCTMELLTDYVSACEWQLTNGEQPHRIPFFISTIPSECHKAKDTFIRNMQAKRRANRTVVRSTRKKG